MKIFLYILLLLTSCFAKSSFAQCPPGHKYTRPKLKRDQLFSAYPFRPGEKAHYSVYWSGLHAGDAVLSVLQPRRYNKGYWHSVFSMIAKTGDWFKRIYIAKYETKAFVRPEDLAVIRFDLKVHRDPPFGSEYHEDKVLEYDHELKCQALEQIQVNKGKIKKEVHKLEPGAIDALSAFYKLRTFKYKIGQRRRIKTYSSRKNWWLEADPMADEKVKVPAGQFMATKIKLRTFFGKEMQQKGDVYIWIAKSGKRPMVKIEGKVALGSVYMLLTKLESP